MSTKWSYQVFWTADQRRGSSKQDLLAAIRGTARGGQRPDWADLSRVAQATRETMELADPAVVARFLLAFTEGAKPQHVLDPWAGLGISLSALASAGRVLDGLAVEINHDTFEVAYGFLSGAWPFGVVEAVWSVFALGRFLAAAGA